jgi:hypothetical protein
MNQLNVPNEEIHAKPKFSASPEIMQRSPESSSGKDYFSNKGIKERLVPNIISDPETFNSKEVDLVSGDKPVKVQSSYTPENDRSSFQTINQPSLSLSPQVIHITSESVNVQSGGTSEGSAASDKHTIASSSAISDHNTDKYGNGEQLYHIAQFQPAWSLHALLRFKSLPYTTENIMFHKALGRSLPLLLHVKSYPLSESSAVSLFLDESNCFAEKFIANYLQSSVIEGLSYLNHISGANISRREKHQSFNPSWYHNYVTVKLDDYSDELRMQR